VIFGGFGQRKTKPNKANFGADRLKRAGGNWLIWRDYDSGGGLWKTWPGAIIP